MRRYGGQLGQGHLHCLERPGSGLQLQIRMDLLLSRRSDSDSNCTRGLDGSGSCAAAARAGWHQAPRGIRVVVRARSLREGEQDKSEAVDTSAEAVEGWTLLRYVTLSVPHDFHACRTRSKGP